MSTQVDQRVVEMRFDNAQFEKGTRQTMSTLDRLKEKLRMKGAEEGLENLAAASEKVDFADMSSALDRVQVKFNALDVVAMTALSHITEQAIRTGEKLVKSLSVDQVASGWDKYTQKAGSVQTIMNATGKSIDETNSYLAKLMWFSDETSYSFTDMTSALATLTSNGGKIENLIPMIEGIANATAYAGKGATEFSRVIYNLSQSYGTGALQWIDWKSVEGANVSSEQLKQTLIDTAVELGTLKEGEVTTGTFGSTLQKKWATTEVMEKGFAKFAALTEAAYQAVNAGEYDTASEAIEALADSYDDVAVKAFKSAQEAKSFAEAIDSTKDAVSSGWMKVFETLFGNKEEATDTWTELANRLYDIFVPPIDDLQKRLKGGLDDGLTQLRERLGDQADVYTETLQKTAIASGMITEEEIEEAGSFGKALRNSGVDAKFLQKNLEETTAVMKARLDAGTLSKEEAEYWQRDYEALLKVNEAIRDGTLDLEEYSGKMHELSGREHLTQSLWNLWDAIEKVVGPIVEAFHEVFAPANSKQIYSFAEGLDNLTKKLIISDEAAEKIKATFTAFFKTVNALLTPVRQLVKLGQTAAALLLDAAKPLVNALLGITAGLGEFGTAVSEALPGPGSFDEKLDGIRAAAKKLLSPLESLGSAMKGTKLVSGFTSWFEGLENGEGLLSGLLRKTKETLSGISPVFASIAEKGAVMASALETAFYGIITGIGELGQYGKDFIKKHLPTFDEIAASIAEMPKRIGTVWSEFSTGFKKDLSDLGEKSGDALTPITEFFTALKAGLDSVSGTDIYRLLSLIDVGLMAYSITQVAKAFKSFKDLLKDPLTKLLDSMSGSFKALTGAINTWKKNQNNNFLKVMATSILMLAGALYVMSLVDFPHLAAGVAVIGAAFVALNLTARNISKSLSDLDRKKLVQLSGVMLSFSAAILAMSIGIASITKSMTTLTETLTTGDVAANVAAFATGIMSTIALMAGLGKAAKLLEVEGGKVIGKNTLLPMAVELVAMGSALRIAASAVKSLSEIDPDALNRGADGVIVMGLALTAMAGVMAMIQKQIGGVTGWAAPTFLAMASGVWIIAKAMEGLAQLPDLSGLGVVMINLVSIMAGMAMVAAASSKMKLSSAAGVIAITVAVTGLMTAMTAFAAVVALADKKALALGFAAMLTTLAALAGASALISKIDTVAAAAAMLTISSSMLVLAGTVAVYARLGIGQIAKGLTACTAGLAIMGVAILLLSKMAGDALQAAWTMKSMAEGLLILAAACYVFNNVNWQGVAIAGGVLAGFIAIMLGTSAILSFFPQLEIGLNLLGKAFWNFSKSIGVLSLSMAALGVLALFAGPVCQAIVNAAPDIEEALIAVVKVICNVIVECAEPLATALAALVIILVKACVYVIEGLWVMIEPALNDLWGKFTNWLNKHSPASAVVAEITKIPEEIVKALGGVGDLLFGVLTGDTTKTVTSVMDLFLGDFADEMLHGDNVVNGLIKQFVGFGKNIISGLVQGIQNGTGGAVAAMTSFSSTLLTNFRNFWGIHSPSDLMEDQAQYMTEGLAEGWKDEQNQQEVLDRQAELNQKILDQADDLTNALRNKGQEAFKASYEAFHNVALHPNDPLARSRYNASLKGTDQAEADNKMLGGLDYDGIKASEVAKRAVAKVLGVVDYDKWSGDIGDALNKYYQELFGDKNPTTPDTDKTPKTSKTKGSSGKTKTVAETIAEKYTAELKANKYLADAAEKEWSLWEAGEGQNADNAAYLAKKSEALTKEIDIQTDRVDIAKRQYEELCEKAGAEDDKAKDAYATWLDEQKTLTSLKREKYDSLYKEVLSRLDNEAATADDEYELWSEANTKRAGLDEKQAEKLKNLDRKIKIQTDVVAQAEKKYRSIAEELGETSQEARAAYREWLNERTEQQKLMNELAEAQLDYYDQQMSRYDAELKLITTRQETLAKLYDDGSLSSRQDDYLAAVEKYGKDSKEARKIAAQGTMSSIISVGTAVSNMSYALKKLTSQQKKYDEVVKQAGGNKDSDEAIEAYQDLLEMRSGFVGFAEDLAEAFDLDDTGKKMMMQLGDALAKNWTAVQNGMNTVLDKVKAALPKDWAEKIGNLGGLFEREGAGDTVTSFLGTIMSAVQGDLGSTITSALSFILNMAGTDFGKTLLGAIGDGFTQVFPQISAAIGGLFANGLNLSGIAEGFGAIFAGGAGLEGVLSGIVALIPELVPMIAVIGAIGAAIWAICNWDEVSKWLNDLWQNICNFFNSLGDNLGEIIQNILKGIADLFVGYLKIAFWPLTLLLGGFKDDLNKEYQPKVSPVVDLSDAKKSAEWMNSAFAAEGGTYNAASGRTAALSTGVKSSAQLKQQAQAAQAAAQKTDSGTQVVEAVNSLGSRIDSVAEAVSKMKVVLNSKQLVGGIKTDMNKALQKDYERSGG